MYMYTYTKLDNLSTSALDQATSDETLTYTFTETKTRTDRPGSCGVGWMWSLDSSQK